MMVENKKISNHIDNSSDQFVSSTTNPLYNYTSLDESTNNFKDDDEDDDNNDNEEEEAKDINKSYIDGEYDPNDSRLIWYNGPSKFVACIAAISALNSCNLGYDQGVNAGVAESMQRNSPGTLYLSDVQLEVFMGVLSAAALVGSLSMFYFSGKF